MECEFTLRSNSSALASSLYPSAFMWCSCAWSSSLSALVSCFLAMPGAKPLDTHLTAFSLREGLIRVDRIEGREVEKKRRARSKR